MRDCPEHLAFGLYIHYYMLEYHFLTLHQAVKALVVFLALGVEFLVEECLKWIPPLTPFQPFLLSVAVDQDMLEDHS